MSLSWGDHPARLRSAHAAHARGPGGGGVARGRPLRRLRLRARLLGAARLPRAVDAGGRLPWPGGDRELLLAGGAPREPLHDLPSAGLRRGPALRRRLPPARRPRLDVGVHAHRRDRGADEHADRRAPDTPDDPRDAGRPAGPVQRQRVGEQPRRAVGRLRGRRRAQRRQSVRHAGRSPPPGDRRPVGGRLRRAQHRAAPRRHVQRHRELVGLLRADADRPVHRRHAGRAGRQQPGRLRAGAGREDPPPGPARVAAAGPHRLAQPGGDPRVRRRAARRRRRRPLRLLPRRPRLGAVAGADAAHADRGVALVRPASARDRLRPRRPRTHARAAHPLPPPALPGAAARPARPSASGVRGLPRGTRAA
jgi:hypothetical protein